MHSGIQCIGFESKMASITGKGNVIARVYELYIMQNIFQLAKNYYTIICSDANMGGDK